MDWKLILEYLKVFLSWPSVFLVIAFLVVCSFRKRLGDGWPGPKDLWSRFRRGEISFGSFFRLMLEAPPTTDQESVAAQTRAQIERARQAEQAINTLAELYTFERAFNVMFGSQLSLLEHLANRPEKRDSKRSIEAFYATYVARTRALVPESAQIALEQYLGFLTAFGFLQLDPANDVAQITPLGEKFLRYVWAQYPILARMGKLF